MPYKFETLKIKLPKSKDKRRKLTDRDKRKIKAMYLDGFYIREIARQYSAKCTRRAIQFVLFPERLKTVNYSGHWKKYYNKEKQREYIKKWRHRKYKIYKKELAKFQNRAKILQAKIVRIE